MSVRLLVLLKLAFTSSVLKFKTFWEPYYFNSNCSFFVKIVTRLLLFELLEILVHILETINVFCSQ